MAASQPSVRKHRVTTGFVKNDPTLQSVMIDRVAPCPCVPANDTASRTFGRRARPLSMHSSDQLINSAAVPRRGSSAELHLQHGGHRKPISVFEHARAIAEAQVARGYPTPIQKPDPVMVSDTSAIRPTFCTGVARPDRDAQTGIQIRPNPVR